MNQFRRLIVGISSIRGVIGERLQPSLAADFASSFGGYVGKGTVLVARDTRPSGIMLEHIKTVREDEKSQRKEQKEHDQLRRCGGTNR